MRGRRWASPDRTVVVRARVARAQRGGGRGDGIGREGRGGAGRAAPVGAMMMVVGAEEDDARGGDAGREWEDGDGDGDGDEGEGEEEEEDGTYYYREEGSPGCSPRTSFVIVRRRTIRVPLLLEQAPPPGASDAEVARSVWRKLNVRILPPLFATALLIAVFRQTLMYSASGMIEDLRIDERMYGAAISAFYLPSALLQLPVSIATKRVGVRAYMGALLAAWGVAALTMAGVRSFAGLMALRVCLGTVSAGMNPVFSSYVSLFYGADFAKAWARSWSLGTPLGNLIGGPLAASLLFFGGRLGSMFAFQFAFLSLALPFFVAGALAALRVPGAPSQCGAFLGDSELRWLLARTERSQEAKKRRSNKLAAARGEQDVVWRLVRDPRVVLLALTRFLRTIAANGLDFYVPLILSDGGERPMGRVALLNTVPIVAGLVFNQFWAWHSDKTGERIFHALVGLALTCTGQVALATAIATRRGGVLLIVAALTIAKMGGNGFMVRAPEGAGRTNGRARPAAPGS